MNVHELLTEAKIRIDEYIGDRKKYNDSPSIANGAKMWKSRCLAQDAVAEASPEIAYKLQKEDDGEHPVEEMLTKILVKYGIDVYVWRELTMIGPVWRDAEGKTIE